MLIEKFGCGLFGFHCGKFVPLGFEAGNDVSNDSSLNSVGFDLFIQEADETLTNQSARFRNSTSVIDERTMM